MSRDVTNFDPDVVRRGKFLAEIRAASGLTQAELATQLGVSRHTVHRIEQGGAELSASQIKSLTDLLGVAAGDLLDGEPDEARALAKPGAPVRASEVRAWAAATNVAVPARGPIPTDVLRAYRDSRTD